jgi:hypothetical protein
MSLTSPRVFPWALLDTVELEEEEERSRQSGH